MKVFGVFLFLLSFMDQHEISFQFKARYYKLGTIDSSTKQVWFVIHGYGQLAQFFIRKFKSLEQHHICVIAPEGLSRFYINELTAVGSRVNDKVGATWMTKENRLMDIDNYIAYLDELYIKEIGDRKMNVSILGFSQGAATASRWAISGNSFFKRLILWAGVFPTDMDFSKSKDILASKEVIQVYGNHDPFINEERLLEVQKLNHQLGINPKLISFDGKHEMDEATLLQLI
jgi:predicted esterase